MKFGRRGYHRRVNGAAVRYEERHWVPGWVLALSFLVPFAVLFGGTLIANALGAGDALSPALGLVYGLVFGIAGAGFMWLNHARRVIKVTDDTLQIGSRAPIPLAQITGVREVSGDELRQIRGNLSSIDGAEIGLPVAALDPGVAGAAVGGAMIGDRHRRAGMISPPWMHSAALIATSTGETRLWLVGSRHGDELVAALERSGGLDHRAGQ
jgi:hypothetical protein